MTDSLPQQLDDLLSEPIDQVVYREKNTFDDLAGPHRSRLVLFGAGNIGRKIARKLIQLNQQPVAFADNNPALWGQNISGIPVMSPADAANRFAKDAAFLITIWCGEATDSMQDRIAQLHRLGVNYIVLFGHLFWKYSDEFLPHYAMNLPSCVIQSADQIRRAFQLMSDEQSRHEFVAQVRWRLHLDFDRLPRRVSETIYFPKNLLKAAENETFVDCGAFDGDTLQSYLQTYGSDRFRRLIALEPDPISWRKVTDYVATLDPSIQNRISCYSYGASDRRCIVNMDGSGLASSAIGFGETQIECVSLDELLQIESPAHIKMDIEGSEQSALRGAAKTIVAHNPVLSVCSYHRQADLWEIPNLIDSIRSGYRFFYRPHVSDVWDLVCYAIPQERVV